MTYDERRERQQKYEKASEQYRSAKRMLNNCEGMKADYKQNKLNLEKNLAVINEVIRNLCNDTQQKIASANRETQIAKADYATAIDSDAISAADISQSFYLDANLDEELSSLISERRRLETEIGRIETEIANLTKKINEYSSQMVSYKRQMNQYG